MTPAVKYLLDFIAEKESYGRYDIVYRNKQHTLPKPITQMTLRELIGHMRVLGNRYGSSASGRYQHIRKTLEGQIAELNLDKDMKFTPELQDDLGWHLLRRRGYDKFLDGRISRTQFGNQLAMEWASLPVLSNINRKRRGQSYYAGDGLNAAHQKPETVERVLDKVLKLHRRSPDAIVTPEAPEVPKTPEAPQRAPEAETSTSLIIRFLRWLFGRN